MPSSYSPLRYPGGKSSIFSLVSEIIKANSLQRTMYAEPFAGGCGLALSLLYNGLISEMYINDIDRGIWSFWNNVLNHVDQFVDLIRSADVSVDEWHNQRNILENEDQHSDFDVGFASFFLNRTNRSGIIKNAGVIGGYNQTGNYKIDCRFNKEDLINKIVRINKYRRRIKLYNLDAIKFIQHCEK